MRSKPLRVCLKHRNWAAGRDFGRKQGEPFRTPGHQTRAIVFVLEQNRHRWVVAVRWLDESYQSVLRLLPKHTIHNPPNIAYCKQPQKISTAKGSRATKVDAGQETKYQASNGSSLSIGRTRATNKTDMTA
jgi:hypothetical protein